MTISTLRAKPPTWDERFRKCEIAWSKQPTMPTRVLAQARAYAFNAVTALLEDVVEKCRDSLEGYGFCVIDSVIP